MIPICALSDSVKLLLRVTVILTFAVSTSCTKQCKPTTPEGDSSVIIKNIGIKLCQMKCAESGQCLSYQYNADTLTCRLSTAESKKAKTKEGFVSLARNQPDVQTGSCLSKMCSSGQRCLKTRSGKYVCVQDGIQNYPEKSPQHEVDKDETFGNSSLHEACRKGNLTKVRRILSEGSVDINSRDGNHGKTPLMVAAQEGHCGIVSLLISKGANMSKVDNDGRNTLQWACKGGHVRMVDCLLPQFGKNIKDNHGLLERAAMEGSRDLCEFSVCMGANVSQLDSEGFNVLHISCLFGHLSVVKYLLSLSRLDINGRGKDGVTPLMATTLFGHTDVLDFLVRMGANVSLVDDDNKNVLHMASSHRQEDMVKHIISLKVVNLKARDKKGRTAAMIATPYPVIYDLLRARGCPVK